MTNDDIHRGLSPIPSIEAVLAAHGAVKVLAAAVAALLRGRFRKTRPPDVTGLSDHLLRDIGLPPLGEGRFDPLL